MRKFVLSLFLFVFLLTACIGQPPQGPAMLPGDVLSLQLGSTLWGLRACIAEKVSTFIMVKDNMYLFIWPIADGWGFAGAYADKQAAIQNIDLILPGNFASAKSVGELTSHLKDNGWKVIAAAEVPQALKAAISATGGWLAAMASDMVSFLVLPASPLYDLDYYRQYAPEPVQGYMPLQQE